MSPKEFPAGPHQIVRELLERTVPPMVADQRMRAETGIQRALNELQYMGTSPAGEGEMEWVHLEYDKFRPRIR